MNNVIIGVDVDDLLLKLVKKWLEVHNKINNDNVNEQDVLSWDIATYTNLKNTPKDFYKILTPEIYEDIEMVDGALDGVNKLREIGRVIFITSNYGNIEGAKYDALNRHGFNVDKKDFFSAYDKSLIKNHVLFDDNYDNVVRAYNKGVLFTRPWNKPSVYTPRCDNWNEIIRWCEAEFKK